MKTDLAEGQTLKEMLASGTVWLGKSAPDINARNVFPVPDGDTGTNMVLTMKFTLEEAKRNSDNHVSSVAKSLAHGALMGARGNSGVILSQFFRGLAKGLDGALRFLKGESQKMQYRKPRLVVAEAAIASRAAQMPAHLETPYGYCANFVLEGQNLNLGKIEKDLKRKGQSLIVTGDDTLVRVHIHSFEPGEILGYATRLGKLHDITINNMDDQYAEFIKMQKERMPSVDIAMVTVATGDGFFELFNSLGDIIIVPGGQTMNPSVRELWQAVESAPSNNIILLPNNKNIVSAASQIHSLTSKKVKVIPTRNIPQGIAALLAFDYEKNLEKNARTMEEVASKVRTIEVTRAARETCLEGLEIRKGQIIAILGDEELIARADKIGDVILEALGKAEAEEAGIVTIYYGAEINSAEAQEIAQEIRDRYHTEVEVVYGGQPHYNYIISLE